MLLLRFDRYNTNHLLSAISTILLVLFGLFFSAWLHRTDVKAASQVIIPESTITNGWPLCNVACPASAHTLLDEGQTHNTSDYIATGEASSGGEVIELGMGTISNVASVESVSVCVYAQSATIGLGGTQDSLDINLRIGGSLQTAQSWTPSYNSWGLHCKLFTGSWTQTDLDGMQAHITRVVQGSGKASDQDDDIRLANVYANVSYTPAGLLIPNEDIANGWTTCSSATCPTPVYPLVDDNSSSTDRNSWIAASTSGGGGEVVEFGLTTVSPVANVSQVEVCAQLTSNTNANGGALDTVSINLRIGGVLQTTFTVTPAWSTWNTYCNIFSGSWIQPDLDGAQVVITRSVQGGGSPSSKTDEIRLASLYATATFTSGTEPILNQSNYRFYDNANSASPGSPLATQDASATVASSTPFRLRQLLSQTQGTTYNGSNFKLQVGEKTTVCSEASYRDISDSGGASVTSSTGFQETANSIISDSSVGTLTWSNPTRAKTTDDLDAISQATVSGGKQSTQYLKATDFGFSIPLEATITGVEIRYYRSTTNQSSVVNATYLVKGGVTVGTDISPTGEAWSANPAVYGSSSTLWGVTLTAAEVNDPGFGVAINGTVFDDVNFLPLDSVNVDSVALNVHYSIPSTSVYYYDNTSVADESAAGPNATDPSPSTGTIQPQTYSDIGTFSVTSDLTATTLGLWDFSLTSDATADGKTYCFRAVNSDGSLLDLYDFYPEVTFSSSPPPATGPTINQQLRGGQSVIDGVKHPFSW